MEFPIDKIKAFPTIVTLLCLGAISSGSLFIYILNKHLFLTIDIFKLTILSMAITLPIICLNGLIQIYSEVFLDKQKEILNKIKENINKIAFISEKRTILIEKIDNLIIKFADSPEKKDELNNIRKELMNSSKEDSTHKYEINEQKKEVEKDSEFNKKMIWALFYGSFATIILFNLGSIEMFVFKVSFYRILLNFFTNIRNFIKNCKISL